MQLKNLKVLGISLEYINFEDKQNCQEIQKNCESSVRAGIGAEQGITNGNMTPSSIQIA